MCRTNGLLTHPTPPTSFVYGFCCSITTSYYFLLCSLQTVIHTDVRGLCHLNVNICPYCAFAETTDTVVFLWRTVCVYLILASESFLFTFLCYCFLLVHSRFFKQHFKMMRNRLKLNINEVPSSSLCTLFTVFHKDKNDLPYTVLLLAVDY